MGDSLPHPLPHPNVKRVVVFWGAVEDALASGNSQRLRDAVKSIVEYKDSTDFASSPEFRYGSGMVEQEWAAVEEALTIGNDEQLVLAVARVISRLPPM